MAANSKNALTPVRIITDGDMSGDVTQTNPTNIQYLDNVSVQLSYTGTPTGSFSVQGSLDYSPGTPGYPLGNPGNWVDITLDPAPAAAGSADSILIDMNQLSFPWIRVMYTAASGSGTLNAYLSAKAV